MGRNKERHSGAVRGLVNKETFVTSIELENGEALGLIRHVAEALQFGDGVLIQARSGRKREGRHRIDIRST